MSRLSMFAALALAIVMFAQSASAVNVRCNVTLYSAANYGGTTKVYGTYFSGTKNQVATVPKLTQAVGSLKWNCVVSPNSYRTNIVRFLAVRLCQDASFTAATGCTDYDYVTGTYPNVELSNFAAKAGPANSMAIYFDYAGQLTTKQWNSPKPIKEGGWPATGAGK